ncbi:MAG: GNAT family N-acetyltransferase [Rickettsiales bacterium]
MIETLITTICSLVPLNASHQERYIELANHPQIRDRVNNSIPYGKSQFDEMLEWTRTKPGQFTWMIETDEALVGVVTTASNLHPQRFQGGYWLDPEYWGRGLATAALKRSNAFLFETQNALRIQAVVEPDNLASIAVLEKCGYACEGLLRTFYPSRYRGLIDVYMYAIVPST